MSDLIEDIDWLASVYENQRGPKCTCCGDCDRERDAAEARIKELELALDEKRRARMSEGDLVVTTAPVRCRTHDGPFVIPAGTTARVERVESKYLRVKFENGYSVPLQEDEWRPSTFLPPAT